MDPNKRNRGQGRLSDLQYQQRIMAGFKKDPNFSGDWTSIRIRPETRERIKSKFGSLKAAFDFLLAPTTIFKKH